MDAQASGAVDRQAWPPLLHRLTGMDLNWLVRLVELPVVLVVIWLPSHSFGAPLTTGLLAFACAAWIGWLCLSHPKVSSAVAGRAVWPMMLLVAAASGTAAGTAIAGRDTGSSTAVALAVIVALHSGMTLRPRAVVTVTAVGVLGLLTGLLMLSGMSHWGAGVMDALLIAGGAAGGVARGLRSEQVRQSRLLLAEREQTQHAREHAATLAERSRIAREVHDVLAHSLADLSIQLEVASAKLTDSGDRSGALQHVRRAHRITADGLEEVRRVVHALRSDTPAVPDALMAMTGSYRDEGTEARFELLGSPRPLPPAVGLALVRTAREAMANARKHAAGRPVSVVLQFDEDRVALTVADRADEQATNPVVVTPRTLTATGVGGGYGLAGMHERLRLVGGSLTAGPSADGWRVHAEVQA